MFRTNVSIRLSKMPNPKIIKVDNNKVDISNDRGKLNSELYHNWFYYSNIIKN